MILGKVDLRLEVLSKKITLIPSFIFSEQWESSKCSHYWIQLSSCVWLGHFNLLTLIATSMMFFRFWSQSGTNSGQSSMGFIFCTSLSYNIGLHQIWYCKFVNDALLNMEYIFPQMKYPILQSFRYTYIFSGHSNALKLKSKKQYSHYCT